MRVIWGYPITIKLLIYPWFLNWHQRFPPTPFTNNLLTCVHICQYECMHMCESVCTPVHKHRGQNRAFTVLLYHSPPILLRHSLSLNLEFTFSARLEEGKLHQSSCLHPIRAGNTGMCVTSGLFCCSWDPNSSSHDCTSALSCWTILIDSEFFMIFNCLYIEAEYHDNDGIKYS